jgi:hypothetical protein
MFPLSFLESDPNTQRKVVLSVLPPPPDLSKLVREECGEDLDHLGPAVFETVEDVAKALKIAMEKRPQAKRALHEVSRPVDTGTVAMPKNLPAKWREIPEVQVLSQLRLELIRISSEMRTAENELTKLDTTNDSKARGIGDIQQTITDITRKLESLDAVDDLQAKLRELQDRPEIKKAREKEQGVLSQIETMTETARVAGIGVMDVQMAQRIMENAGAGRSSGCGCYKKVEQLLSQYRGRKSHAEKWLKENENKALPIARDEAALLATQITNIQTALKARKETEEALGIANETLEARKGSHAAWLGQEYPGKKKALEKSLEELRKEHEKHDAWRGEVEARSRQAGERKEVNDQMNRLDTEYMALDRLCRALAPKGPILAKLAQDESGGVNEILQEVLGDDFVSPVELSMEPWSITLGGRSVTLASTSERFRAGVGLAMSLAKKSGLGLVLLDGADVLTKSLRSILVRCFARAELQQAFVATTADDAEIAAMSTKGLPDTITYWKVGIDNGVSRVERIA